MSTSTERISGHITADTIEDAERQAREWAEAEPNIESYEIVSIDADQCRVTGMDVAAQRIMGCHLGHRVQG